MVVLHRLGGLSSCSWSWSRHCLFSVTRQLQLQSKDIDKHDAKWLNLPPFSLTPTPTTALKWVLRCCPHLPRTLVHKLFRLRQVRRSSAPMLPHTFKRVTFHSINFSFSFFTFPSFCSDIFELKLFVLNRTVNGRWQLRIL